MNLGQLLYFQFPNFEFILYFYASGGCHVGYHGDLFSWKKRLNKKNKKKVFYLVKMFSEPFVSCRKWVESVRSGLEEGLRSVFGLDLGPVETSTIDF